MGDTFRISDSFQHATKKKLIEERNAGKFFDFLKSLWNKKMPTSRFY
jgi:hypothetical protein